MKLKFNIHYTTAWGENLFVVIKYKSMDGRERSYHLPMRTDDGEHWFMETAVMESRQHPIISFSYYYQVENDDTCLRREWNMIPREYPFDSTKDYLFLDKWRDVPLQYHLYTRAFRQTSKVNVNANVNVKTPLYRKTVIFRVSAPQLSDGETLALCGNHPSLGDWNPSRFLKMTPMGDYDWILSVNVEHVSLPIEYKYVIVDEKTNTLKTWEEGDNRIVEIYNENGEPRMNDGQVAVLYGEVLRVKETTWKAAGVAIPVFSLRSEHSFGVGDFGDLKRLVDWAEKTGLGIIQILPIQDTTTVHGWTDSHPYNCISAFAFHPHYLDLEQMPALRNKQEMNTFSRQRRELNALDYSDYMAVDRVKSDYISKAFEEQGEELLASQSFKDFMEKNGDWLKPYSAFCALRDKFNTSDFRQWKQYAEYSDKIPTQLVANGSPLRDEIRKIWFVQYYLHKQLTETVQYAHSKGIAVKGDLPVSVYRDSVETWQHPSFFRMDMQLGTPPSSQGPMGQSSAAAVHQTMFYLSSATDGGQNWGFPPVRYDDEEVQLWFQQRLEYMEQFFDAVRFDHIVSFFRVWEIPVGSLSPVMGHFYPSLPISEEEMGSYGLVFRKELFTHPFINDNMLEKFFGVHASYVREHFLVKQQYGMYSLMENFNTQVKIRDYFKEKNDESSIWIRDGLYRLCSQVLFLEDPCHRGMYLPRFDVFKEPVYQILSSEEKDAFMRLYNNYYYERHDGYWTENARKALSSILGKTRMLICGEDMGLLPHGVASLMDALRILSLEIQVMPKDSVYEFTHLESNPYRSVATISTHDMAPLRLWWEEDRGRVQRYYTTMLQKEGKAPRHLPAHLAEEIIARHLYSPSMLCVLSLQDWLAMDNQLRSEQIQAERINAPYDSYNQWKYRMSITLEQLMEANQYNDKLRQMVVRSKRHV